MNKSNVYPKGFQPKNVIFVDVLDSYVIKDILEHVEVAFDSSDVFSDVWVIITKLLPCLCELVGCLVGVSFELYE